MTKRLTDAEVFDLAANYDCGTEGEKWIFTAPNQMLTLARDIEAAVLERRNQVPNNDEVICPSCTAQFRAIPVNVQRLMLDAGFEPPFTAPQPEPVNQQADAHGLDVVAYLVDWPDEPDLGHYFSEDFTDTGRCRPLVALESVIAKAEAERVEPDYDKNECNAFVQALYDMKMREGKRGHYETMFHVVHQAIKCYTPPAAAVSEAERVSYIDMNKLELKAEEAECVTMCLNDRGVPTHEGDKNLSLWGRVEQYAKSLKE